MKAVLRLLSRVPVCGRGWTSCCLKFFSVLSFHGTENPVFTTAAVSIAVEMMVMYITNSNVMIGLQDPRGENDEL